MCELDLRVFLCMHVAVASIFVHSHESIGHVQLLDASDER